MTEQTTSIAPQEAVARMEYIAAMLEAAGADREGDVPEWLRPGWLAEEVAPIVRQFAALESRLRAVEVENERLRTARETPAIPLSEWHEDDGTVLWWRDDFGQPPYVGSPLDSDWSDEDGWTHFTRILNPVFPTSSAPLSNLSENPSEH